MGQCVLKFHVVCSIQNDSKFAVRIWLFMVAQRKTARLVYETQHKPVR